MTVTQITDHVVQAKDRLITQYKEQPNIEAIVETYASQRQEVETVLFQLLNERSIDTAVGQQLDLLGDILDEPRTGLTDNIYSVRLLNKISQLNSEGTAEDLINIYKILMQADSVQYGEIQPAHVVLLAINPNPIGELSEIAQSLEGAKPAGVSIQAISTPSLYLGFEGDPDGVGLGDLTNATVGGHLSEII